MAVTTLGYSLWDYLIRTEVHNSGDYFLQFDYTSSEHLDSLSADDRVSDIGSLGILGYTTVELQVREDYTSKETCAVAAGDQAFFDMVSIRMEEGRLPQNSNEIVITENIYHYLKDAGHPCEIGDTIELNVVPEYEEYEGEFQIPADGDPFTKAYTIVGISETFVRLGDLDLYLSHLFTFADFDDAPLWYRIYLKTHNPRDAYPVMHEMPKGIAGSTNDSLLEFYGATQYGNYNTVITLICGVLAAIIMVGSISLIYNAFSISVSERTKQFGLLSSIGATRKQIRRAVFTEAMLLSAIGIPLGLLSGYVGIAITLNILSTRIHTLIASSGGTIFLEPKLSWLATVIASAIALFTVLISAAIPAGRATKISPIDAIRQKNDYAVPKKTIRVSKTAYRLFGLPGALSRKYYKVSKKKYRATVISLVISIILFISASCISTMISGTIDRAIDTENFDMLCMGDKATLEEIRNQDFVEDSAYYADSHYLVNVPDNMLSDSYLKSWPAIHEEYDMLDKNMHDVRLIYLEDSVFKQYLREHDLPEEPYFGEHIPTALVVAKEVTVYNFDAAVGETDRFTCPHGDSIPIYLKRNDIHIMQAVGWIYIIKSGSFHMFPPSCFLSNTHGSGTQNSKSKWGVGNPGAP
ncbi:MAG: FtsX-like permease family protein [Oscillospiraceae bacterium]|nr:FtsX-like permease family protein [Oscillospiraceae bacterium]